MACALRRYGVTDSGGQNIALIFRPFITSGFRKLRLVPIRSRRCLILLNTRIQILRRRVSM
ncbi:MAG: hypothetical protein P8X79_20330 [Reinekea sp.]